MLNRTFITDKTKEIRERFAAFPFINASGLNEFYGLKKGTIRLTITSRDPIPLQYQEQLLELLEILKKLELCHK